MNADTPVTSGEFSYSQALMILNNPASYDNAKIRRAAVWMLGCLTATPEEIDLAAVMCMAIKPPKRKAAFYS